MCVRVNAVVTQSVHSAEVGCQSNANSQVIQSVLHTFQQLCTRSVLPLSTLKLVCILYVRCSYYFRMNNFFIQVFCFNVSALLHCGGNTVVSALEALHQLLLSVNTELEGWLLTEDPSLQVRKLVSVSCQDNNKQSITCT